MGELHEFQLFVWVGKMLLQVLGHAEALLALLTEHRLHGLVRGEPLFVLGVHQLVFLEVGPDSLHTLQ